VLEAGPRRAVSTMSLPMQYFAFRILAHILLGSVASLQPNFIR